MKYFKELADINIDKILKECLDIIDKANWENMQISLQYTDVPSGTTMLIDTVLLEMKTSASIFIQN